MEEKKVAWIPSVVVQGALGPKGYGVLLTDQRSIFVLRKSSKSGLGAILGGAVGAAIAEAMSDSKSIDYAHTDPNTLAADSKNISIPHLAIQRLRMKKRFAVYRLLLEYTRPDGKKKKLQATLFPPLEQVKEKKTQGIKPKQVAQEYARRAQEAYRRALPSTTAQRSEWMK